MSTDSKNTAIQPLRILGIDPGSVTTGIGIIDVQGARNEWVFHAAVRTGGGDIASRLNVIFSDVSELIKIYQPTHVAIEDVFVGNNASSALKLGQARGAAICAAVQAGLPVHEYSAKQIKQSVVGTGAATKSQMQHMVQVLLNLSSESSIQTDAADALGVALCHGNSRGLRLPMQRKGNRRRSVRFTASDIK